MSANTELFSNFYGLPDTRIMVFLKKCSNYGILQGCSDVHLVWDLAGHYSDNKVKKVYQKYPKKKGITLVPF